MKTVKVDGATWKGTVSLYDPQTIEQEAAFERSMRAFRLAVETGEYLGEQHAAILPGILENVAEWKLKGFPERVTLSTFPTKPRNERNELIALLVKEISQIYKDGDDPNE